MMMMKNNYNDKRIERYFGTIGLKELQFCPPIFEGRAE